MSVAWRTRGRRTVNWKHQSKASGEGAISVPTLPYAKMAFEAIWYAAQEALLKHQAANAA